MQAIKLLANREHSKKELAHKLSSFPAAEVDEALVELETAGLQSDLRFTETYVRSRFASGFGPIRIRAELKEKGIADDLIRDLMESAEFSYRQSLAGVAAKKFGANPPSDNKELARRVRFLAQRGFELPMILSVLRASSGDD